MTHQQRIGSHGMVLVTDGVALYASHMPLYRAPHDYQLVYLVESSVKSDIIEHLSSNHDNNMVTILPAKFDLNTLINGASLTVATQFFKGHFERGGEPWLSDARFTFSKPLFRRSLSGIKQPRDNIVMWKQLSTATTLTELYVHHINTRPSFDALVLGRGCNADKVSGRLQEITVVTLKQQFSQCDSAKVLYVETADFAK